MHSNSNSSNNRLLKQVLMVTLTYIQLLQLNRLSSKLSSNLTLVAAVCSLKPKPSNKLLLVMGATTLTTMEQQLQPSNSSSNNNKQQQVSLRFNRMIRHLHLHHHHQQIHQQIHQKNL